MTYDKIVKLLDEFEDVIFNGGWKGDYATEEEAQIIGEGIATKRKELLDAIWEVCK